MNTKGVRIHSYTPTQLILGFNPTLLHFDSDIIEPPDPATVMEEGLPDHQIQIYTALRDKNKCLASEAAAYTSYSRGRKLRQQRIPEPGDLVVVRNHAVDKQHGRKLEAKWLGPRMLVR